MTLFIPEPPQFAFAFVFALRFFALAFILFFILLEFTLITLDFCMEFLEPPLDSGRNFRR
mgnify:CR=1 FL=1